MPDIYPPNLDSPVGRVRKYVPDLVQLEDTKNPAAPKQYYFSDVEISGFIGEYADAGTEPTRAQVKRAAADVIDALANNEALVLKKIKTEDLQTDGAATANALRAGARALRQQADDEDAAAFDNFFDIVPFKHYHPQTRLPWRR